MVNQMACKFHHSILSPSISLSRLVTTLRTLITSNDADQELSFITEKQTSPCGLAENASPVSVLATFTGLGAAILGVVAAGASGIGIPVVLGGLFTAGNAVANLFSCPDKEIVYPEWEVIQEYVEYQLDIQYETDALAEMEEFGRKVRRLSNLYNTTLLENSIICDADVSGESSELCTVNMAKLVDEAVKEIGKSTSDQRNSALILKLALQQAQLGIINLMRRNPIYSAETDHVAEYNSLYSDLDVMTKMEEAEIQLVNNNLCLGEARVVKEDLQNAFDKVKKVHEDTVIEPRLVHTCDKMFRYSTRKVHNYKCEAKSTLYGDSTFETVSKPFQAGGMPALDFGVPRGFSWDSNFNLRQSCTKGTAYSKRAEILLDECTKEYEEWRNDWWETVRPLYETVEELLKYSDETYARLCDAEMCNVDEVEGCYCINDASCGENYRCSEANICVSGNHLVPSDPSPEIGGFISIEILNATDLCRKDDKVFLFSQGYPDSYVEYSRYSTKKSYMNDQSEKRTEMIEYRDLSDAFSPGNPVKRVDTARRDDTRFPVWNQDVDSFHGTSRGLLDVVLTFRIMDYDFLTMDELIGVYQFTFKDHLNDIINSPGGKQYMFETYAYGEGENGPGHHGCSGGSKLAVSFQWLNSFHVVLGH